MPKITFIEHDGARHEVEAELESAEAEAGIVHEAPEAEAEAAEGTESE